MKFDAEPFDVLSGTGKSIMGFLVQGSGRPKKIRVRRPSVKEVAKYRAKLTTAVNVFEDPVSALLLIVNRLVVQEGKVRLFDSRGFSVELSEFILMLEDFDRRRKEKNLPPAKLDVLDWELNPKSSFLPLFGGMYNPITLDDYDRQKDLHPRHYNPKASRKNPRKK